MAGRHLSADEAALWQRVAGSVRAIRPASRSTRAPEILPVEPATVAKNAARQSKMVVPGKAQGVANTSAARQNTLDGSWDKKIGEGRLTPDRTIDLHGYNLAAAHQRLDRGLEEAIRDGARVILLITGRPPRAGTSRIDLPLRGIIRESIGDWLGASRLSGSIAAVRNAHPRHGGAGALYIVLRRTR